MFSTVVGCGKSEVSGDNNSTTKSADVETTKEATTEATESTETEGTTSDVEEDSFTDKLDYTKYPISEETKSMLIEKLTNLQLVKGQEFDTKSLTFKDEEIYARYIVESILASAMFSQLGNGILKCNFIEFEIYKVENQDNCMVFYFKRVSKKY